MKVRHIIFVSDGESPEDGISDLMKVMHDAHITVSAIGIDGADRNLLSVIADKGGGQLYMVDDIKALPKIVLKDMKRALP